MKKTSYPDLELRGKLVRGLGSLREMLPGSFVERKRACGQPNCRCADGKNLHSQFQISVLVDGKPKALNIPAELDRKSTRLNSSHQIISYPVFCLKKKNPKPPRNNI